MNSAVPQYLFWTKQAEALFAQQLTAPRGWASWAFMLRLSAKGLEELWRRDYERLTSGEQLSECAYVLVALPCTMLNGMALECLAKAIIVGQERTAWNNADRLPKSIRTHDLATLLERAGVSLSDAERELAVRLTTLVEWFGRYPVPTKPKDMRIGVPTRIEDLEVVSAMYARLQTLVPESSDIPTP